MPADQPTLPVVDLSGYINPKSPGDKERVIEEVRDVCGQYGFFQAKGHGVAPNLQQGLLNSIDRLFDLPDEEKMKLSFLNNSARRGYEKSGMSLREGDALPDSKEAYYISREDPKVDETGLCGPNVWPPLPEDQFHKPVWEYYQATYKLGQTIWEIILQGLGHPLSVMDKFAKAPMVPMKMIRYPPQSAAPTGSFGVGAHSDFGGVTVLLQQPGKHGLEVYHNETWIPVQALEDVYVINCGDMLMRWSGGQYKSAKHRVLNKTEGEFRLSCATFFHGDLYASNPLDPSDPNKETVGQLLVKRFRKQFSYEPQTITAVGVEA